MTRETYRCQACSWVYRSPVRLQDPPLHTCKATGRALSPTKLVVQPAEAVL